MKRSLILLLSIAYVLGAWGQSIAIEKVNIIDVRNGEVHPGQYVLLENGLIRKIEDRAFKQVDQRIDGSGKFLIPGLWDMHVHLSTIGEESIPLFVANGVTGVRDMGGDWTELKKWRSFSENDDQTSFPIIRTAGPIVESVPFYYMLSKILGREFSKNRVPVADASAVRPVVDSIASLGVDFLKIRTAVSQELFLEVLQYCDSIGLQVTGHIDQSISIEEAVKNGISTIEHDLFLQTLSFTDKEKKAILEAIAEYQPYFTPTLIATYQSRIRPKEQLVSLLNDSSNNHHPRRKFVSPVLLENWNIEKNLSALEAPISWDSVIQISRSFAKEMASHTKMLAGTDAGVAGIYPGWGLHEELQMMTEHFRCSPLKALQASTLHAAASLNLLSLYGTIEEGKKADLLLLEANPLQDISNTQKIAVVFKNGIQLDNDARKQVLLTVESKVTEANEEFEPKTLQHLNKVLRSMRGK